MAVLRRSKRLLIAPAFPKKKYTSPHRISSQRNPQIQAAIAASTNLSAWELLAPDIRGNTIRHPAIVDGCSTAPLF
jgi:hypothetical protein